MRWFDGSIRNAIDKVKSSGVVLLVFVQGEDSLSKKYDLILSEETKFKPQDYVAIKILHDSVALQQFKQIYITVPVPSVFLIESNGIPMSIVSSDQDSEIFSAIREAVEKQKNNLEEKNKPEESKEMKEDNFLNINKKSLEDATSKTSQPIKNVEFPGHKLFDLSEEEIKQRLNEIRSSPRFLLIDSPSTHNSSYSHPVPKVQSARIQFRLPNNEMPSWEFPDLSTLGDVRAYLTEKTKLAANFKFLRTYPWATFTPQDECKTLAELSLTPNATLIIVPMKDESVQSRLKNLVTQENFFSFALKALLHPLLTVLEYFKTKVFRMQDDNNSASHFSRLHIGDQNETKKTTISNIHSLKFEEDTDTDNEHPDNGNSTQQRYQK